MQIEITIRGNQKWKRQAAVEAVLEAVRNVDMDEELTGGVCSSNYIDTDPRLPFTIPASPRVAGTHAERGGDRETVALVPREDGYWYVQWGGVNLAGFMSHGNAATWMRYITATAEQQEAVRRVLAGDSYIFLNSFDQAAADLPNCKGGGGEIEDPAGADSWCEDKFANIRNFQGKPAPWFEVFTPFPTCPPLAPEKLSAAEAPAIHDLPPCRESGPTFTVEERARARAYADSFSGKHYMPGVDLAERKRELAALLNKIAEGPGVDSTDRPVEADPFPKKSNPWAHGCKIADTAFPSDPDEGHLR